MASFNVSILFKTPPSFYHYNKIAKVAVVFWKTNMTEKEHINQYIKSTCDLIIQHVKNIITLQENINKPWGYSSRLMEHLFHPENELLFKGYSKNIFNNKSAMAIKPWKEHIVPMAYVFNNLWVLS